MLHRMWERDSLFKKRWAKILLGEAAQAVLETDSSWKNEEFELCEWEVTCGWNARSRVNR